MTKKSFIALADMIRQNNSAAVATRNTHLSFGAHHIGLIADFCAAQNPQFNRSRWLDYIAGKGGSNGGAIKPAALPFKVGDSVIASPVFVGSNGFSARVVGLRKDTDGTQLYTVKDQDDEAFDLEASELVKDE